MYTKAHKSRLDCIYTYNNLDENAGISLASSRDMCYNHTVLHNLDELCTTTTISTTQRATIIRILKSIRRNSMRIMRVMGKITKRLHINTTHDIIRTHRTRITC
jgi:hypothetical protein